MSINNNYDYCIVAVFLAAYECASYRVTSYNASSYTLYISTLTIYSRTLATIQHVVTEQIALRTPGLEDCIL